mmetsp:Transcript_59232/g.145398  ORF Transcript_59232/g.145398 Transcript_59232/m.145398 type:complete len:268 (-) Transcript_59232:316-1119(-)
MHHFYHSVPVPPRTVHPIIVRHKRHGPAHVPESQHKPHARHVVTHDMPTVGLLKPRRGSVQARGAGLNTAAVPIHVPTEQRLKHDGSPPPLHLQKPPPRRDLHHPLPVQLTTQVPTVPRLDDDDALFPRGARAALLVEREGLAVRADALDAPARHHPAPARLDHACGAVHQLLLRPLLAPLQHLLSLHVPAPKGLDSDCGHATPLAQDLSLSLAPSPDLDAVDRALVERLNARGAASPKSEEPRLDPSPLFGQRALIRTERALDLSR